MPITVTYYLRPLGPPLYLKGVRSCQNMNKCWRSQLQLYVRCYIIVTFGCRSRSSRTDYIWSTLTFTHRCCLRALWRCLFRRYSVLTQRIYKRKLRRITSSFLFSSHYTQSKTPNLFNRLIRNSPPSTSTSTNIMQFRLTQTLFFVTLIAASMAAPMTPQGGNISQGNNAGFKGSSHRHQERGSGSNGDTQTKDGDSKEHYKKRTNGSSDSPAWHQKNQGTKWMNWNELIGIPDNCKLDASNSPKLFF
jgi:hypothetical protein